MKTLIQILEQIQMWKGSIKNEIYHFTYLSSGCEILNDGYLMARYGTSSDKPYVSLTNDFDFYKKKLLNFLRTKKLVVLF